MELARVQWYRGSKQEALDLLAQPLASSAGPLVAVQHRALRAAFLALSGKMDEARNLLQDAEQTLEHGTPSPFLEATRGEMERSSGNLGAAAGKYRSALHGAEALGDGYLQMRMLLNLGVVEVQLEQFDEGRIASERAFVLAKSLDSKVAQELLTGNEGYAYLGLGDYVQAETNFRKAESLAHVAGARADELLWTRKEGLAKFLRGDREGAETIYQRCLNEALQMGDAPQVADAHTVLGQMLLDQPEAARPHLKEAARIYAEAGRQQDLLEVRLLQASVEAQHGDAAAAQPVLLRIDHDRATSPSLRWQAEQELATVAVRRRDDSTAHAWFERAVRTFRQQQCTVRDITSKLPFQTNGADLYRSYIEHLIAEGRTDAALMIYDEGRAASLRSCTAEAGRASQPGSAGNPKQLAEQLHGTILVYYLLPKTSYLWAVAGNRTGFYRLPGQDRIEALVSDHEQLITDIKKDPLQAGDEAGKALYQTLIAPARALIQPAQAVYILADSGLSKLNFETLVTPGDHPHFWIEDVTIINAASLRLLAEGLDQPPRRRTGRLLLVGDPNYPRDEELPHAAEEVTKIAAHFAATDRTVLTREGATSEAYERQDPSRYSLIHFVAHAQASVTSPMDSYVLLSGGSDKLYARDILKHPLTADLVTLSSCFSSGTGVFTGEGLVGLAWAFERAGSRNVIGALWEVSDDSAPRLMDHMYANLALGMPPDRALRDAKLTALHSPDLYRKPFYWAQFQLYSNSGQERPR